MAARVAAGVGGDDALPLLDDLMPWSVRPLRTGRPWVTAAEAASLRARWDLLAGAERADQERLFRPSRSRTPLTPAAALPGRSTGTGAFARHPGPYPEPVRILHGPFDEQWLIPDHRLLDAARPEMWRVADGHQIFAVEHGYVPQDDGPCLSATALLPDGHAPAGRPGRIRPLYRRPGGQEPNLAPGLPALLSDRYGTAVSAESVLAWILAAARPSAAGLLVPLPTGGDLWARGVELGQELLRLQLRGARGGERPRLPGGRRPYVRAPIQPRPDGIRYDAEEEVLVVGEGRVSPVPAAAWDFRVGGVRMLELWFERRTAAAEGLAAVGPRGWPRERTSELLELITVLALLAGLGPRQEALRDTLGRTGTLTRDALRTAGVLPVPASARRPASVLDHREEGPEGQFALL
ncbi:type ISP restriction/modification enzyme [Streptomyces sp. JH34]|uniref:type ISP restriction/modification enzyme n=1 Tax=Streptomyces sp. JH34 TaxID=2793633 RepID=UPI0023FA47CA|nr:type ISP restriction/modification enzyme [Streptomyces sp. JH34]MDF6022015.1 DNA methyltransferase [Streptomyces sp. JH34]